MDRADEDRSNQDIDTAAELEASLCWMQSTYYDEPEDETDLSSTRINDDGENLLLEAPKRKSFYLEPVVFLLMFAGFLVDIIMANVIQAQYCSAILHRPQADCHLETTTAPIPRDDIETFTATFGMLRTLMEGALPCLQSFFVGPWSDKYGRRPLIITSALGNFIRCALYVWASRIPLLNPMYFIMFSIPYSVCGGSTFMFLSSYCYICDTTTTENRTTRLGILQCVVLLGITAALRLSPYLENVGYPATFTVAAVLAFAAFVYAWFILPESLPRMEIDTNAESRNPFSYTHIRDLIDNCYIKQTPANRLKIVLTVLVLFLALTAEWGDGGILYVFLQKMLNIRLDDYTLLLTYIVIIGSILVAFTIITFTHILKVDDLYLLSFTTFIRMLGGLSTAFGCKLWHFYISRTLNTFTGITGPLLRSYLSKIIPQQQLGKVFSLLMSAECLAPVIAAPLYAGIYDWTITIFPGTTFLVTAFLMLIDLFLVIALINLSETPPVN